MTRRLMLALVLASPFLRAEEGMWTFDNLPLARIHARFGFTPDQPWLDHLRLSSLRLQGGSASFVSREGLVLTNHHMVRGSVQRLSTPERDLLKHGFTAANRDQEIRLPGVELMQLQRLDNITERVATAARAETSPADALRAREREIAKAREELRAKTGLTIEPVVLYQGGETWLYGYRKFKDVRLVAVPELSVARFGGDHDNFTYPRHHLDFALLRVYEDGKPYAPDHYLRWSQAGLKPGEPAFITGHPGTTNRLYTTAQMAFARDVEMPMSIASRERRRADLEAFAQRGAQARSQVGGQIYGLDNGLKAAHGFLAALRDAEALQQVVKAEAELKAKVMQDPRLKAVAGESWDRIAAALEEQRKLAREQLVVNTRRSEVLGTALHLVRLPVETARPEARRLSDYTDAALVPLRERLTRPRSTPFNPDLEMHLLATGLQEALDLLGPDHPFLKAMLAGRTPAEVARTAVSGTKLQDPAEVKRILDGGAPDPADAMLALARRLDPLQRALQEKLDTLVDGPLREHGDRIARARFTVYGKSTYPDANSTLRLTYGTPETYPANGTLQPPFTTLGGLYDRFMGWGGTSWNLQRDTWRLPARWLEKRALLNPDTPYNFASTHDIIGGNSGSPMVDAKGELVGLAFDGNTESHAGRYYYDGRTNRTVNVDARAIREVLAKVMDGAHLVTELDRR